MFSQFILIFIFPFVEAYERGLVPMVIFSFGLVMDQVFFCWGSLLVFISFFSAFPFFLLDSETTSIETS